MRYLCFDTAINNEYTLFRLRQEYAAQQCLFQGTRDENIWDAAPWLFRTDDDFYARLSHPLVKLDHCLLIDSPEPMSNLCEYLQAFIYRKEKGKELFFRFWDARVLHHYLAHASAARQQEFFGDMIDAVYLEKTAQQFVRLSLNQQRLLQAEAVPAAQLFPSRENEPGEAGQDTPAETMPGQAPKKRRFLLD